jgi:hypothetical protein
MKTNPCHDETINKKNEANIINKNIPY